MKAYVAPVNPLHANPYTEDDLWWVDGAWNQETVDLLVAIGNKDGDPIGVFQEAKYLSKIILESSVSNLPCVIPDGDWLAEYYLGLDAVIPNPERFRNWEEFLDLSKAVRLYMYLCDTSNWMNLTTSAPSFDKLDFARSLLLVTAEFTEADIQFLLVDGGSPISNFAEDMRHNFWVSINVLGGGALRFEDLPSILRNHSLAASDTYLPLVSAIVNARTVAERGKYHYKEERNLLRPVLENPAVNREVLDVILEATQVELRSATSFLLGRRAIDAEVVDEAESRLISRFDRAGYRDLAVFFQILRYHPNFMIEATHPLVDVAGHAQMSGIKGPGKALPTVSVTTMGNNPANLEGSLRFLGFRSPKDGFVKVEAKRLGFGGFDAVGSAYDDYYHVAYGLGRYLKAIKETKAMFADGSADGVPVEWLEEIAS